MAIKMTKVTESSMPVIDQNLLISHIGNIDMLINLIVCYGPHHPEVEPLAGRLYETIYKHPNKD